MIMKNYVLTSYFNHRTFNKLVSFYITLGEIYLIFFSVASAITDLFAYINVLKDLSYISYR